MLIRGLLILVGGSLLTGVLSYLGIIFGVIFYYNINEKCRKSVDTAGE